MDKNLLHEAMLSYWGERCPDYHQECVCCQAWEQYDGKTSAQPAQRQWVDLTEEEIEDLFESAADADEETHIRFALAIQAKFKMKNI